MRTPGAALAPSGLGRASSRSRRAGRPKKRSVPLGRGRQDRRSWVRRLGVRGTRRITDGLVVWIFVGLSRKELREGGEGRDSHAEYPDDDGGFVDVGGQEGTASNCRGV